MKKVRFLSLFLIGGLLLAACNDDDKAGTASGSAPAGGGDEKKFVLSVNNFDAPGGNIEVNIYAAWEKLVEEKTGGRVDVQVESGGVLGPPTTMHTDLEAGLFDVGFVIPNHAYDTNFFPYTVATLPFAAENSKQAAEVLAEYAEKVVDTSKLAVKVAAPFTTDGYDLVSGEPINVNELKGLKMRVSTSAEAQFIQALGAGPVALKPVEAYEGLQKGTIDLSFAASSMIEDYSIYEVAPYIKRFNFTHTPLIPAMNQDFYDELPADLQQLFDEELLPAIAEIGVTAYVKSSEETFLRLEEYVKGKGEITTATPEERALMQDASKAAWASWIKDANDRGYDGQALVDAYFEILDAKNIARPY